MAVWGCGSPAGCCQPAVAGGFIYADLRSELNTHLARQALFTQSSLGCDLHCCKLSPFWAHWGRWHCTNFLRPACLFTVHMGSGPFPLSCGVFFPPPLLQAFPLLVAGWVLMLLPSSAGLLWGIPLPPLWCSGSPTLLATCLFCCYCLLFSFFSFFLGGGWSVQGAMLIWPRVVCGSTMYCLAHLVVCIFPRGLALVSCSVGTLLVSPFKVKWRCYAWVGGVEESKFCLFSVVFLVRYISSISPRFYFRKHTFCFLPLAAILESLDQYLLNLQFWRAVSPHTGRFIPLARGSLWLQ
jgi:hypothetical protein